MNLSKKYEKLLKVINSFKARDLAFREFSSIMRNSSTGLGGDLNYEGDFFNHIDSWLELIEYCYLEDDWYALGLSVADYIERSIRNFPAKTPYPSSDIVLRDHLPKLLSTDSNSNLTGDPHP